MSYTKKDVVEAALLYQDRKNSFIEAETEVEVIPDSVKLKEEDFTDQAIERLVDNFEASNQMQESNCLHCVIHKNVCDECEYTKVFGESCLIEGSIYKKANKVWQSLQDESQGQELHFLGIELMEVLENMDED